VSITTFAVGSAAWGLRLAGRTGDKQVRRRQGGEQWSMRHPTAGFAHRKAAVAGESPTSGVEHRDFRGQFALRPVACAHAHTLALPQLPDAAAPKRLHMTKMSGVSGPRETKP